MPPRERIDRYEIDGVIGHGSMGVVYRARDPVIGRELAVKTIRLSESAVAESPESKERFARELRAAGILSHPNIVTVYDAGNLSEDSAAYMAMEYVEGRSLRERIRPGERMRSEDALDLALQVARALDYAHARGIVHRDVKPGNILIREDGLAKLADFGIARFGPSDVTKEGGSVGSPSYVAPEVLRGEPVDGRADLFSLGVVLYEVLTGARPFQSETLPGLYHQILSSSPVPPASIGPEIPAEWDAVILKLLAKRPSDRYAEAGDLLEDLRRLERGLPAVIAAGVDGEATLTKIEPLPPLTAPRIRSGRPPAAGEGGRGSLLASAAPLAVFAAIVAAAIFVFDRPGSAVPPRTDPVQEAPPVAPSPVAAAPKATQASVGPTQPKPARPRSAAKAPPRQRQAPPPAQALIPDPPEAEPEPIVVPDESVFRLIPLESDLAAAPEPVTVNLSFEHSLEEGRFSLMVDGETVLSESIVPFEGRRRSPQRALSGSVRVAPGPHVVAAVAVDHKGRQWREESAVVLEPGRPATLSVALRGPLKKRLRIELR